MPPITTAIVTPLTYVQSLVLGLVEGITEFLPVSSNAHMLIAARIAHHLSADWPNDPGAAFAAIVQLGPILAVIAYFRRDLLHFLSGLGRSFQQKTMFPKGDTDARLGWFVIFGTVPIIVIGLALHHIIETSVRSLYVVIFTTMFFGLVLWAAERAGRQVTPLKDVTWRQAALIGLAQTLALVPGTSRSGITITAGLFTGLTREAAARFSFLLSVPAITLAGLYELYKTAKEAAANNESLSSVAGPYLAGTVLAGIVAYGVIHWLLGYLRTRSTLPFVVYRLVLGVVLLYLVHVGILLPQTP